MLSFTFSAHLIDDSHKLTKVQKARSYNSNDPNESCNSKSVDNTLILSTLCAIITTNYACNPLLQLL